MTTATVRVSTECLARIDEALTGCTRNLIPIDELRDTLLDLRQMIAGLNDSSADRKD